jgi:peptidylprolyl isomerase
MSAEEVKGGDDGYVDLTGDGGLKKKILVEGEGESPSKGDEVCASYIGTLDDGTEFDRSRSSSGFKFKVGKGQVIKGWDVGFATMKKGEKAILKIRSDYGYGSSSAGKIPPNSDLTFEVELLSFGPSMPEPGRMSDAEKIADANAKKEKGTEVSSQTRAPLNEDFTHFLFL